MKRLSRTDSLFFYLSRMRVPVIFCCILLFSCSGDKPPTRVSYFFSPFYQGKIYLERLPSVNEEFLVLDSATVDYKTDHLSFSIPPQEDAVFRLRMPGKPLQVYFINDVAEIIIEGHPNDPKDYHFRNKGVNPHLKDFLDSQRMIYAEITALTAKAREGTTGTAQATLLKQADSLRLKAERHFRHFADTTTSAGAFLFTYDRVDFGADRDGLKKFISKAGDRFPAHSRVQELEKEVLQYISIFEEELNIGDRLPDVRLPDVSGNDQSTALLKGRYVFVDLWTTWCAPCTRFIPFKKALSKKFPEEQLGFLSIAVDAEKDAWKQVVLHQQLPGMNLIDVKMWRGPTVNTWKFDSIPFNFLVSPDGRIVAKAIKADSLDHIISKFVKR